MSQLSHKHLVLLHGVSLGKDSECPSPSPGTAMLLGGHAPDLPVPSPLQVSWCRSMSGTGPWTST